MTEAELDRFLLKLTALDDEDGGCWQWVGPVSSNGYGNFTIKRKNHSAHRIAYQHFIGEVPLGLQVDHLCGVRTCVNPDHLEAVTCRENIRRSGVSAAAIARHAARTHCKHGHEFTPENTQVFTNGRGNRVRRCRACVNATSRRRRLR